MTGVGPAARRRALGWGLGWAVVVGGLLGACASPPPVGGALALTAAGRLSVRIDPGPTRGSQSMSAGFEWRGDGTRGELTLLSPLGTQLALARWSPGSALLITPEGQTRFDTLDELAERALGERVPLMAWPDWLAGRPWPGAPAVALPASAQVSAAAAAVAPTPSPAGFDQLGWEVDLSRHAEGRIEARRRQPPAVTVRIVLDPDATGPGGRP